MAKNIKYSRKDFTNIILTGNPASDFNNTNIVGSCFYNESNDWVKVFPADMTGVTFIGCNLDNVIIPEGNFIDESCSRRLLQDVEDVING